MDVLYRNPAAPQGAVSVVEYEPRRIVARRHRAAARYLYVYPDRGMQLVTYPGAHEVPTFQEGLRHLLGELDSPLLLDGLLERLGRDLPPPVCRDVPQSASGVARAAAAKHPLVNDLLLARSDLDLTPPVPGDLLDLATHRHLRSVAGELIGVPMPRAAARALAERMTAGGRVSWRDLQLLPALRGLQPDHVTAVLTRAAASDDASVPDRRNAQIVSGLLAGLGSSDRHVEAAIALFSAGNGGLIADTLGAVAALPRFVTTGCRSLGQLLDRIHECFHGGAHTELHGAPTGDPALVWIVVRRDRQADLGWAASDLANCLDAYDLGDGVLLVAADPRTGRAVHAVEIDRDAQVRHWEKRANHVPSHDEVARLMPSLLRAGVRPAPVMRPPAYEAAPF